jgi:hypothetical protein
MSSRPGSTSVNPRKLYKVGLDPARVDGLLAEGLMTTLDLLYDSTAFATVNPRTRRLTGTSSCMGGPSDTDRKRTR